MAKPNRAHKVGIKSWKTPSVLVPICPHLSGKSDKKTSFTATKREGEKSFSTLQTLVVLLLLYLLFSLCGRSRENFIGFSLFSKFSFSLASYLPFPFCFALEPSSFDSARGFILFCPGRASSPDSEFRICQPQITQPRKKNPTASCSLSDPPLLYLTLSLA